MESAIGGCIVMVIIGAAYIYAWIKSIIEEDRQREKIFEENNQCQNCSEQH